ncbi:MAG: glycosyltransferase [Clostridia bacterium]|nr:glycosyltransferase [Clostridia bacterium]
MKPSVIIPMYNESKIIAQSAKTLSEYMCSNFEEYEIIFFDDGSRDNSMRIVESLQLANVRVLGHTPNRGKGSAVREAMLSASGDVKIFTDADLAYGTDVIKKAVDLMASSEKTDIIIGSRNLGDDGYEGYTFKRKLMSKVYIKILCFVGGFKLSDSQCGFKAFRAQTATDIFSECSVDGFAFDFEAILIANKKNKNITEIPVKIINHRESSVRPISDALKMLKDLRRIKKNVNSR